MRLIRLLFILLILTNTGFVSAAKNKAPKEVKLATLHKADNLAIKNANGQDGAKNNLLGALGRESLTDKDRAGIYYTCALLDESSNSVQNMKA